jgi:hypothetical protein
VTTTNEFRVTLGGARVATDTARDRVDPELRRVLDEPVDVEGVLALVEWARSQDFGPDAAERIRREAWS